MCGNGPYTRFLHTTTNTIFHVGKNLLSQNVYNVRQFSDPASAYIDAGTYTTILYVCMCMYMYICTTYYCRGLLLPKIVVDDFGGSRSDPGMLGSGIYFAASARYVQ